MAIGLGATLDKFRLIGRIVALSRHDRWPRGTLLKHQAPRLDDLRRFALVRSAFYRRFHHGLVEPAADATDEACATQRIAYADHAVYGICFPKERPGMTARPFIVAPRDYAPALNIVGEQLTVLASGEATDGYEIFLQRGAEGSGPPPHSHPWDESFFVIKGQVDFGIDAESTTASAGTLVHLPAGTVHWFRFGKGGGEMLSMTSRLGASQMFADLAREVDPVNPDLGKLADVGARHGLKVAV